METGTFLLSALRHQPDPSAREAIRQEVEEELRRSTHLDRETWLKVSLSAPKDELARALEEKMERYHELLEAVGDDLALKTDIEVILGRASTLLRLTRQALVSDPTATQAAGPPPPETEVADTAGMEPSLRAAGAPTLPPMIPASAPPPRVSPVPVPPFPEEPSLPPEAAPPVRVSPSPEPETALPKLETASSAPAPAEPPDRAETAPPPQGGEPAERAAIPASAAPGPTPESPRAPADSPYAGRRLEDLMMEAGVRMTVSDYANAVRVYAQIVDLEPRNAGHHVRLAIAMACYPLTAKKAEREFLEAIRLEPDSADIHFQFGLYYKAMRQRARALAEMRTAVRLNPRHKQARQELEVLSPKDSALTSLRKLFR
jgi:tetratricopeptide (TPR) repeat protein